VLKSSRLKFILHFFMITKILNKILGDYNLKEIRKLEPVVEYINKLEEQYQHDLKDEDIPRKTEEFKKRIAEGESLDDILPEAFALVKNACRRLVGKKWEVRGREITWDMVPYNVQIIGGLVLHHGKIAEMKTGEGKTLVCTMPLYLNALTGKGTHLVTVNSYLASRDAEWMGGLYRFLGLTVGVIEHAQSHADKQAAYNCDITYGTNNEFGFDYLRDNMVRSLNQCVQRKLNYAIVDEVDSILIDEARTPLIISAPAEESTSKYMKYAQLIPQLQENKDFNIDEKIKTAILTEEGIKKMEDLLGMENIYAEGGFQEVNHIEQALKAHTVYKKDVDYMVKDGEVIIVDSFTGRLMPGRRYSAGLHQAIEAKEGVEVKRESKTMATITFQNYFRMYGRLAGMTGTAMTEAEEFGSIYNLDTISIPTNKPVKRLDRPDAIYKNQRGKYMAIAAKTKELHEKGQPVLIGTVSIEKSELLSGLLKSQGIKHEVLNAKQHEKEAEIVAKAGQKGAVTIATNMAGRGTDIKLGEGVTDLGGLYIMGTERHESRRIDNQLRGRAGRQGDQGETQFYVSMEDDLMRLFGADSIKKMMEFLRVPDDMVIENRRISKSIENAQKAVEGRHFDIRKHLVEYDDVINRHREIMYGRRRQVLESENIKNDILILIEKEVENIVLTHVNAKGSQKFDYKEIHETMHALHSDPSNPLSMQELEGIEYEEKMIEVLKKYLTLEYLEKEKTIPDYKESEGGSKILRKVERDIYFRIMDSLWMQHIDEMSHLRENVALRSYGQRDPLVEYKGESYKLFQDMQTEIQRSTVNTLFKLKVKEQPQPVSIKEPAHLRTNEAQIDSVLGPNRANSSGTVTRSTFDSGTSAPATAMPKVGRNEPCPCGSGKKFKKCCGK